MMVFKAFLIMSIVLISPSLINGFGDQGNDDVVVKDTGSSNFSGYQMVIGPSGEVNVMVYGKDSRHLVYDNGRYNVPPESVKKLINDLDAVMPLSGLGSIGCAKSASFGTRTYVTYKGQTSPDIQCMKSEDFIKDIYIIKGAIPRAQNGVKLP
jgi:hypothetical protein